MAGSITKFNILFSLLISFFLISCGGGSSGGGGGSNPSDTFSVYFYDGNLTLLGEVNDLELNSLVVLNVYGITQWYLGGYDTPIAEDNYTITGDTRFYAVSNVVEISNQTILADINTNATTLNGTYILLKDIELNATDIGFETDDTGWKPIGNSSYPFTGIFSGSGHNISGLWINRPVGNYTGLFGYVDNAVIKNLGVEILGNVSGAWFVGGIAGHVRDSSITNSYTYGNVSGTWYVGGIAGRVYNYSTIINSYATGSVSGVRSYIGGIVGEILNGNITNSYTMGNVNGGTAVGGIAGYAQHSNITNSYALGSVNGTDNWVGGVAGYVFGISTIENNAAINPSVTGSSDVNRVVGRINNNGGASIVLNNFVLSSMVGGVNYDGTANNFSNDDDTDYRRGIDKPDGDFTAPTTLYSDDALSGGLGWSFGNSDSAPWNINATKNGGLPYLYWQKL